MEQLDHLQTSLDRLRAGTLAVQAFCRVAREQTALRDALPPRYDEVLQQLLDRLESSALFTEESCSFSQSGLLDNLQVWLDKARAQLDANRGPGARAAA